MGCRLMPDRLQSTVAEAQRRELSQKSIRIPVTPIPQECGHKMAKKNQTTGWEISDMSQ